MNTKIVDNVAITYLLADAVVDVSIHDFETVQGFDACSIIDKVNENVAAELFEGFKAVEFYRICAQVFRQRAIKERKPLVVILRGAADIVYEMYKAEVMNDG